jgi:acyl carrier protein
MADRLSGVVAAVLGLPVDEVSDEVGRGTLPEWTSLRHLQLVAAVEDAFGTSLSPREIRAVATVGDLRACLLRHADAGRPEPGRADAG